MADQESSRADRFASRGRNAFALAAGLFAVTQAVAFGSFAHQRISSGELDNVLVLAALAAASLALAGLLAIDVDRTMSVKNLDPEGVIEVVNDYGSTPGGVIDRFVELYARFVYGMRRANEERRQMLQRTTRAVGLTIFVTLAELLYAFWVRR